MYPYPDSMSDIEGDYSGADQDPLSECVQRDRDRCMRGYLGMLLLPRGNTCGAGLPFRMTVCERGGG